MDNARAVDGAQRGSDPPGQQEQALAGQLPALLQVASRDVGGGQPGAARGNPRVQQRDYMLVPQPLQRADLLLEPSTLLADIRDHLRAHELHRYAPPLRVQCGVDDTHAS